MFRIEIRFNDTFTNFNEFATEELCNAWYEEYLDAFPEGHTKQIFSLAEELLDKQRDQESDEAVELGTLVIKRIRKINRRKLKLGLWSNTQFNALLASSTAAQIERALWNGSLGTAAYLLTNMSDFYSDLEIGPIVDILNAHETKWSNLI